MIRRLLPLTPLLVILGALALIFASGAEIAYGLRGWLAGSPWPPGLLLDALVAGSAILLAVAVLIARGSMLLTAPPAPEPETVALWPAPPGHASKHPRHR